MSSWPRFGASKLVSRAIAITLGASIFAAVDGGWLARWTALVPSRVFHGELWRLVTWPFVEVTPLSLLVTCIAIFKFGGELAIRWGDRRLQRFMMQVLLASGMIASVLATAVGMGYRGRLGGWAMTDVLVIAWARQFPDARLVLYGLLVLHGRKLVQFTLAVAVLFAVYYGAITMAPELAACGIAAAYPRDRLSRL